MRRNTFSPADLLADLTGQCPLRRALATSTSATIMLIVECLHDATLTYRGAHKGQLQRPSCYQRSPIAENEKVRVGITIKPLHLAVASVE
jgi:hypothetical protein